MNRTSQAICFALLIIIIHNWLDFCKREFVLPLLSAMFLLYTLLYSFIRLVTREPAAIT
ncbi:hypothetical protein HMPREF0083_01372 [Aneurinibacillus aneurinilyticus ATCC 12856]|uniref:Uncharacterized protein n=1 Tax=Aneurinibacillus aneurinilyticus ATCC 12856 TaxID=649747 RepID=U1YEE7_ANEAE|nr:hypothetical protein HMPREF0083_01372 [Aneurinibacillus aneurinilyticus ATCC 12856]